MFFKILHQPQQKQSLRKLGRGTQREKERGKEEKRRWQEGERKREGKKESDKEVARG